MRYRSYGKVSCIHMAIQIYAGPFRPIFFWGGGWGGDCTNHFGPPYVLGRLNFSWMVNLCAPLEKLGPVLDFSLGGGGGGPGFIRGLNNKPNTFYTGFVLKSSFGF